MSRRIAVLAVTGAVLLAGCGGGPGDDSSPAAAPSVDPTSRPAPAPAVGGRWGRAASAPLEDTVYPEIGEPVVDALHYGLDLRWDKVAKRLRGVARIRFRVAGSTARGLPLDLSHALTTSRVVLDGRDVTQRSTHRDDQLLVDSPVGPQRLHTLVVTYAGVPEPAKPPTDRLDIPGLGWTTMPNGQVRSMQEPYGAFTWYPVNDQPSDKAFYDVRIDAPGTWVGVSNGQLLSRRSSGGRTVTRWHLEHPAASYLTTVAIGPYRRYTDTGPHGLPISYWVRNSDRSVLPLLRKAPAAIRFLERRLGPIPSQRMGFLVVPQASGMETQDMITLGIESTRTDNGQVVVHELSHQWYGDAVTPRDWRDVWMSEGMATYVQAEWTVDQGLATWRGWKAEWRTADNPLRSQYGPPGDFRKARFGQGNVYYPPAFMWRTLRERLGATTFDRLRRGWVQQHLYSSKDRDELADWWSQESGTDLHAFFTSWLMSRTTPAT
jgi:aminopeptidase N